MTRGHQPQPPEALTDFFEGERLELTWRYAYRPEFVPLLMEYIGAQPEMHILEVGCGTGFLSRLMAQTLAGVRIVGLDPNEKSLNLGRQLLERDKLTNVELQQGVAYPIAFPDAAFDLVTSQTLLWILPDPAQGLREMVRVTRPGGTVSAIACFCHSGNLPHYHGRYPLSGNNRLDQLDLKLERLFRLTVRPRVLGVDHTILNLDLLWQFKSFGLQEVQINSHLVLMSPGDARIPVEEGSAYALPGTGKI